MGDFIASVGASAVYDLLKTTIVDGVQHANRLCHYESYERDVKILIERLDILEKHREELITMVDSAKQMGNEIHRNVTEWLIETNKALSENRAKAKRASQNISEFLLHPQRMIDVDTLSRISMTIDDMIRRCVEFNGRISYPSPYLDRNYMAFEGRRLVLEGVMDALRDCDVKMIGLLGMGGIGKTTLAKEIARQAKKEANLFDKVIMSGAVSQTPDYATIQLEIANNLNLKFDSNDTTSTKADKLRQELSKQMKVLIILDDLWQQINLFDIGIHFNDDQNGCKILYTSRLKGLYNDKAVVEFALNSLEVGESNLFFCKVVDKKLDENPDYKLMLNELVEECGGVPIVINTVASALKDAPSSKWRTFLNEMRKSASENIDGMESKVFRPIKMSYYFLESKEAKSLLLLCSIFPEDRFITDDDLLMYSVGWPLLKRIDTLENARDKVHTLIDTLRKNCLLLPSDKSKSEITYHWVKLHDVTRDVLKSIALEKGLFSLCNYEELPEENLKDLLAMSLHDDANDLPNKFPCPNLVFLHKLAPFIGRFSGKCLSDCLFEETKKLRVLKLQGVNLRSPPSSFRCLVGTLQTLCLNDCDLKDTTFLGSFKNLKCLDLSFSRFKKLSKRVGELTRLQLLNLSNCHRLEVIEPDVISSLINLEELYMSRVDKVWDDVSLAELKKLPRLNTLCIEIANDSHLSKELFTCKMKRYKIIVGESIDFLSWKDKRYSRVLQLKLDKADQMNEWGIDKLMSDCQALQLRECNDVSINTYILYADGFPELEVFELHDASNVRYIVNSALMECNLHVFQNLEKMELVGLSNLQKICEGELVADSFSKLKVVEVSKCHTLKNIFPASNIGQLEKIKVKWCRMMEEIVYYRRENAIHQKIEFLKLQNLKLCNLSKLVQFCKVECELSLPSTVLPFFMEEVSFPNLEKLYLKSLNKVKMIWPDQPQQVSYLPNLKDLNIANCQNLKYLFSFAMARCLVQLRKLRVKDCKKMEWILVIKKAEEEEEEGSLKEAILFPKLEYLELDGHRKLKSFCVGKYLAIECPSLKILNIDRCPKLKIFIKTCTKEKESENHVFNRKKTILFPNLEDLTLKGHIGKYVDIECQSKKLKKLRINVQRLDGSEKILALFNKKASLFASMEELDLNDFNFMQMIWPNQLEEVSYMQNLKKLKLWNCGNLKYLFSLAMASSLVQLKELNVQFCETIQEIIVIKEGEEQGSFNKTILLPKLEILELNSLSNLRSFSAGKYLTIECPSLKSWRIRECPRLKTYHKSCTTQFEKAEEPLSNGKILCGNLEELQLGLLDFVHMIWPDQVREVFYMQNLKYLTIWNCRTVKYLFTLALARSLVQLTKLSISSCEHIEEILLVKEVGEEGSGKESILFPKLEEIDLWSLSNLKSFSGGKYLSIECPSLKSLKLRECPKLTSFHKSCTNEFEQVEEPFFNEKVSFATMKRFSLSLTSLDSAQMIWKDQLQEVSCMQNFKELSIKKCQNLKYLFSFTMARRLVQLKRLIVEDCENIEEILVIQKSGKEGSGKETILFPKLHQLDLSSLPNLRCFSNGKYLSIDYPSLKLLKISKCPKLNTFHQSCTNEFEQAEESLFNEKVSFANMEELDLSYSDSVQMIWPNQLEEVSYMQNLKKLRLRNCGNLKYICSLAMARSFIQLKELNVEFCETIQEVLVIKEAEEEGSLNEIILFPKLEILELNSLSNLRSFSGGKWLAIQCPSLKSLILSECPRLKTFHRSCTSSEFENAEEPLFNEKVSFPKLGALLLESLNSVHMIWHDQLQKVPYVQNLNILVIVDCENLKYIFSVVLARSLVQLRILRVEGCVSMEGILDIKETAEERSHKETILFPELEYLLLLSLSNLKTFNGEKYLAIQYPSLKMLTITQCPILKTFHKSWTNEIEKANEALFNEKAGLLNLEDERWKCLVMSSFVSFQNLVEIEINGCYALINLMDCSTAKSLVQLQTMIIALCDQMTQVIVDKEGEMVFPQLKTLVLHHLPKLESFNCGNSDLHFPSLENVTVNECPNMENFSRGAVITTRLGKINPKLRKVSDSILLTREDYSCLNRLKEVWEGDLKTSVRMIWEKHNASEEENDDAISSSSSFSPSPSSSSSSE